MERLLPPGAYSLWERSVLNLNKSISSKKYVALLVFGLYLSCVSLQAQFYTFTNAGASGMDGPTQSEVNSAYTNTPLNGQVTVNNGIQYWVVPSSGNYIIEATGASGGGANGGLGADMEGVFTLSAGDTVLIAVGQEGAEGDDVTTSGGGGTYVAVRDPSSSDVMATTGTPVTPLIIAGGGGGNPGAAHPDCDANTTNGGNAGDGGTDFGVGGTNGNGGAIAVSNGNNRGGGGGGFLTDGERTGTCTNNGEESGLSFLNGSTGGQSQSCGTNQIPGGFGGGGGGITTGWRSSGGGGGYSGGGGGQTNSSPAADHRGGGGGSYNNGLNQNNLLASTTGHGSVVITPLSSSPDDAGVVSVDSPTVYCPGAHDVVATIQNFGNNVINNVTVEWSVNGTAQTSLNYTGTLDTIGGTGSSSAQVNLGSYTFTSASYNVQVWTSMPNGNADNSNSNDTVSTTLQSSLPPPTALSLNNIFATSAGLSWTPGSASNSWEYQNLPAGGTPSGSGTAVSSPSVSVTGLSPTTSYDFYVREVCPGGGNSSWAGPVSYTTPCAVITAPHLEDFQSGASGTTPPNCWTNEAEGGGDWEFDDETSRQPEVSDGDHTLGPGNGGIMAWIDDSDDEDSTNLLSPLIDVSGLNSPIMSFWFWSETENGPPAQQFPLHIDVKDAAGWHYDVAVFDIENSSWEQFIVDLSPFSDTVQVRFSGEDLDGDFYKDPAIDDVNFEEAPTCLFPTNFASTNVSSSTVDLSWNAVSNASGGYSVIYGASGFNPATGGTTVNTSNTNYSITGLSSQTAYDFYIFSDCGAADGISDTTGPVTETTLCQVFTTPYFEDFENASGTTPPNCWTNEAEGGSDWNFDDGTGQIPDASDGDHTLGPGNGGTMAYIDDSDDDDSTNLLSPLVDVSSLNTPIMTFWFWSETNNTTVQQFPLHIDVKDAAGWHYDVAVFDIENSSWEEFLVDLSPFSDTVQVRFSGEDLDGDFYKDIAIDDVSFEEAPPCLAPTSITVSNITSQSVDLSWNAVSNAVNGYTIIYGTSGFNPNTGGTSVTSTTNSYTITGLSAQTGYDVYVLADCGATDGISDTTGPVSATTPCAPVVAPYLEDFESGASGTTPPNCWINEAEGGSDWNFDDETGQVPEVSDGDHTLGPGNGGIMAYIDDSDDDDSTNMLSPLVDISNLIEPRMTFWFWSETNTSGSQQFPLHIDVKDASGWHHDVAVFDVENTQWERFDVDLSSFSDTVQIRFSGEDLDGNFYKDIAIDDVSFEETPDCESIFGAAITNIDTTEATLSTNDTTAKFQYEWGPCGFTQGTGTVVSDSGSAVISGLSSNTCYDVYIRRDCDTAGYSAWTGPFSFYTLCTAQSLPYIEDFSGGVFPNCWDRSNTTDVTYEASCGPRNGVIDINYEEEAVTPDVDVSGVLGQNLEVSYYIGAGACINDPEDTEHFHVEYWDGSQWVLAKDHDGTLPESFVRQTFYVPAGQFAHPFKVRFNMIDGTTDAWQIDSVVIQEAPPCLGPNPATLGAANITDNSADLFWGSAGEGDKTYVEVGPVGFSPGTGTAVVTDSVAGSMDTLSVSVLSPQTTYEFYIQDSCVAGGLGSWIGPYSFTTQCLPASFPYFENFISVSNFPVCWSRSNNSDVIFSSSCGSRSSVIEITNSANVTTPNIDVSSSTSLRVSYLIADGACGSAAEEDFHVDYWDGSQWVQAQVLDGNNLTTSYSSQSFILPGSSYSNLFKVRFDAQEPGGTADDWMIDSVVVEQGPTCFPPLGLTANNVTDTSATLSWNSSGSGNSYQVWFGPQGFFQGTQTTGGVRSIVSGNSLVVDTLSEITCYEYLVRSICAPGDTSIWEGPFDFCTSCSPKVAPYFEDFETASGTSTPQCWTNEQTDGAEDWEFDDETSRQPEVSDGDHTFGPNGGGIMAWLDDSDDEDSTNMLSPVIDISGLSNPQMTFWMWSETENGPPAQQFPLHIDVKDASGWHHDVAVFDEENSSWEQFTVDLSSFSNMVQVRFSGEDLDGDFYKDIAIDDVRFADPVTCRAPVNLAVNNVLDTAATLVWTDTAGTSVDYEIWVGPQGFYNGLTTTGGFKNVVSQDSAIIDTLTSENCYEYLVRGICGPSDTSFWSGPYSFCTEKGYDASLDAIVVPGCGDSLAEVKVAFTNLGVYPISSMPATVNVSGSVNTTLNATYSGNLASMGTDTLVVGTINTVAGGNTVFDGVLNLTDDQDASNDSLSVSEDIGNVLPPEPIAAIDTLCGAGLYDTLYFPAGSSSDFHWLTTTNDTIGSTDSLVVGPMGSNDTTFLLSVVAGVTNYVGAPDNSIGSYGDVWNTGYGLYFDVLAPVTIESVDVYPTGSGDVEIILEDDSGNQLASKIVSITGGSQTVPFNVDLGFSVPPGVDYVLRPGAASTTTVIRNSSGGSYPYTLPGVLEITGNLFDNGPGPYYYYFYNWEVSSAGCPKPDGEMTIYNGSNVNASFTSTLGTPTDTNLTVNFDASGSTGATSYHWDFGDGNTGSGMTTSHNYSSNDTVIVELAVSGPCGTDTIVDTLMVEGIKLPETILERSFEAYPNPTAGLVRVNFDAQNSGDAEINIMDLSGRIVRSVHLTSSNGNYETALNINDLADGTYMIKVSASGMTAIRRIVKQ